MRYLGNLLFITFSFIILINVEAEYKVLVFFALVIAIALNTLLLTWTMNKRRFQGQIMIQKNAPPSFYTKVILLTLFAIFSFSIPYDTKYIKYLNFGFLALAFTFDEVDNYIKRKFKYDSLIIDNTTLIVNGLFVVKRDLRDLVKIKSFDLGDYLILTFRNAKQVTIERSHYDKVELWDFINRMTSYNPNSVVLTPGVLEKF